MHIEKSLDVIDYDGIKNGGKIENFSKLETYYFNVEKICVNDCYKDCVGEEFYSYTVIGGNGSIVSDGNSMSLGMEDTIYIPNGVEYIIDGNLELLKSYV